MGRSGKTKSNSGHSDTEEHTSQSVPSIQKPKKNKSPTKDLEKKSAKEATDTALETSVDESSHAQLLKNQCLEDSSPTVATQNPHSRVDSPSRENEKDAQAHPCITVQPVLTHKVETLPVSPYREFYKPKKIRHGLHCCFSCLTAGLWCPCWCLHCGDCIYWF
eukprot:Sdes_comp12969_c0_seq1m3036